MARLSSPALIAVLAALATGAAIGQRRAGADPAGWAGVYSARFDGGAQGEITIVRQRNARAPYRLRMNMWTRTDPVTGWCNGRLAGSGGPVGSGQLTFAIRNETREGVCRVALSRARNGVRVEEDNCVDFHGAACTFDGVARKRR